ncbi:aminotransferase class V-fold PLP-dependent enzyme [Aestuariibacter sp. AA17]|uniref:Aminotransferase class V-fold PLP-dependent enzyme n=1 Tax=Fluctibacter corallii TaxID=2984329 RepID=A0ABT3AC12_9ALTE|nr:aminotransferase class V-fold PLP-dependent enzyme [Aestuariibacter sp. AA17]MCV2886210.1 aminotransferase class V-fold PLP-dependent enzyme [Aestuariibacter sp. AA17]
MTGFDVPEGIYLLSHSVGCLPRVAKQALNDHYLSPWSENGGDAWPNWLEHIDTFCDRIAMVINGAGGDVCPQSNLSSGLTKYLLAAFPVSGKKRVLMHGTSFPSMGFVVSALASHGFELVLIDDTANPTDPETWEAALSNNIDIALVSHVYSNTGMCAPVEAISQMCQARNIRCVVDAAQSIGVIPIDVQQWQADVVLGSCVKWLCGGPGAGFMWINPTHIEQLQPVDVGWFSHENPFEFDIRHFAYRHDAKRFWGGTPSVAPYVIAASSVQYLLDAGIENIASHNKALQRTVLASNPALSERINMQALGGTLCLSFSANVTDKLSDALTDIGARFDRRGNALRLSFHIYNSADDAAKVADVLSNATR